MVKHYVSKIVLATGCLLLVTAFSGCATVRYPYVSRPGTTIEIDGRNYVSARSLAENYDLEYEWDAIVRKVTLKRDAQEARMMADSSTALLNKTICAMGPQARFYQNSLVIPQSFVCKSLIPFFRKGYGGKLKPLPRVSSIIKRVIIDPGHGGKDPGAIGRGGLKEKDVVLDIAKSLKKKLEAAGIDVVMTRDDDRFVSLAERTRIANTQRADLLLSIHANASRSRWTSGVEVFYLDESIDDNLRCAKAAKNYDLHLQERYSGKNTEEILWHLKYREDRKSSIELAKLISHSLSGDLRERNRGDKSARFYVLQANVPAILIEVGFISNLREEKNLRDRSHKDRVAQAIAQALKQYSRECFQRYTARY